MKNKEKVDVIKTTKIFDDPNTLFFDNDNNPMAFAKKTKIKTKKDYGWNDKFYPIDNKEKEIKKLVLFLMSLTIILFIISFALIYWAAGVMYKEIHPILDAPAPAVTVKPTLEEDWVVPPPSVLEQKEITGISSWYNYKLNGIEWGNSHATAASKTLNRYSYVKITNIANNKSVIVFINDYVENPKVEIDLSSYAFQQIAPLKLGLINVKIETAW